MKPPCLPHMCRSSPDRFGQAVRRKYEAVTSSRSSPDQFSEISGIFRKNGPGKRAQVRRASFTVSFYRANMKQIQVISPTHAVRFLVLAPPRSPRRTSWNPGGSLVEPSWNLTSGPPRTTPEPIWAETPKLSAVGENKCWNLFL